jgi:hypothetical protein
MTAPGPPLHSARQIVGCHCAFLQCAQTNFQDPVQTQPVLFRSTPVSAQHLRLARHLHSFGCGGSSAPEPRAIPPMARFRALNPLHFRTTMIERTDNDTDAYQTSVVFASPGCRHGHGAVSEARARSPEAKGSADDVGRRRRSTGSCVAGAPNLVSWRGMNVGVPPTWRFAWPT